MRQLWSPWRMEYIESEKPKGCVLCDAALSPERDEENNVLYRGEHVYVIMNRYPYINGHLMVAPYMHVSRINDLSVEAQAEMMSATSLCVQAIEACMSPDGFNMGMNMGQAAGAGIADHIHMHIVPRWIGDTNFMSVFCESRVICEGLQQTYVKLKPEFERLAQANQ